MKSVKSRKELARLVFRVISNPKDAVEMGDRVVKTVEKAVLAQQIKYKE